MGARLSFGTRRGQTLRNSVAVKGVEKFRRVTARVLDDTRDLEPCAVSFADGVLTWRKADFKSCALLVTWEM